MALKIGIFGTSNSVIPEGWVAGFTNGLDKSELVNNFSVGGSCAAVHILQALRKADGEYDIIIMDSLPNDTDHFHNGFEAEAIKQYINDAYTILSSRTRKLISILFPSVHKVSRYETDEIYHYHKQMAEKNGAECIDLYKVLPLNGYEKAFRNKEYHHLADSISNYFGSVLAKSIKKREESISKITINGASPLKVNYHAVTDPENFHSFSVKQNSVFKEDIKFCSEIYLDKYKGCHLVGLLHWSEDYKDIRLVADGNVLNECFPFKFKGYLTMNVVQKPVLLTGNESLQAVGGRIGFVALLIRENTEMPADGNCEKIDPCRVYTDHEKNVTEYIRKYIKEFQ